MLTIRCTKKLLNFLGIVPEEDPPQSTGGLGDWYAKPVPTVAGDLILFVNERSLLTVAVPVWEASLSSRGGCQMTAKVGACVQSGVDGVYGRGERKSPHNFNGWSHAAGSWVEEAGGFEPPNNGFAVPKISCLARSRWKT